MAKKTSRLTQSILATANSMYEHGVLEQKDYDQIMNELGPAARTEAPSPEAIRALREREHMSQAAFAARLNLTPGYISQLERGVRRPRGATVALLKTIERNGIQVVP